MKRFLAKTFCLILSIICLGCSCLFSGCKIDPNTLYVYTNASFPPYEYLDKNGNVVGVDIDIIKEVGKRLGYKVRVCDVEFGAIFMKVQNNPNAIGAAGITITEERKQSGLFSIPYTVSRQFVLVEKDEQVPLNDNGEVIAKEYFKNKTIGVQLSTTGNVLINDLILSGELESAKSFEYKNALVGQEDIGSKLNCFVIDILPAKNIERNENGRLKGYPIDEEPEWYGFYLNKNSTELKEKIDGVLQELLNIDKDGFSQYVQDLIDKHS